MAKVRSESAHKKILNAALDLFSRQGIDATSMDSIANTAGVSKATIYSHWKDKEQLALEVISTVCLTLPETTGSLSGNFREDLTHHLSDLFSETHAQTLERLTPHIVSYSAANPNFGMSWRQLMVKRHRLYFGSFFQEAIRKKLLSRHFNIETGISLLMGPILYRHIFIEGKRTRIPEEFLREIAEAFSDAFEKKADLG